MVSCGKSDLLLVASKIYHPTLLVRKPKKKLLMLYSREAFIIRMFDFVV